MRELGSESPLPLLYLGEMKMFDKIKQVLVLLQEVTTVAPSINFTGGILFGLIGTLGLVVLIIVAVKYFRRRLRDKAIDNHILWNSAEGLQRR